MDYTKLPATGWLVWLALWLFGCANVDERGNPVGMNTEALSTSVDIDFENYATGPLGSPWTVTSSGSGTASIVSTSDHGKALKVAHTGERDYTFSSLGVTPTTAALEFEFAVRPKNSASTFTVTLRGQKTGYKNPRFAIAMVPGSNEIRPASAGTPANGHCGTIPYGAWSTINCKLVPASTVRRMEVRVNGVMTAACSGVATSLRSADTLVIGDNQQPSANAETLLDDFFLQSGVDGEL